MAEGDLKHLRETLVVALGKEGTSLVVPWRKEEELPTELSMELKEAEGAESGNRTEEAMGRIGNTEQSGTVFLMKQ